MSSKPSRDKEAKKQGSKDLNKCCQGGYGYMKRRLGLLSFEADKINEQKKNDAKE